MSEAVIRQRLIRLSCAKLLAFKKSSEGLRRSLHVLTVLKHAHSDEARFEPECSDLLFPQINRLVVTLEPAPLQRIPSSSPPSSPPGLHLPHQDDDHEVPSIDTEDEQSIDVENDENSLMETDTVEEEEEECCDGGDGTSMARKRKNHTSTILDYENAEKRHHLQNQHQNHFSNSTSISISTPTSKSLEHAGGDCVAGGDQNNNNNNQ